MITVRIYESSAGTVSAVVYRNKLIHNLVTGLEHSFYLGTDFIRAAQTGFQFADSYDPADWGGLSLSDAIDEVEYTDEEIAQISGSSVTLYREYMGAAGKWLFAQEFI